VTGSDHRAEQGGADPAGFTAKEGRALGWQEDGSYVPCELCHWMPSPPDAREARRPGRVPPPPVGSSTHYGDCPTVPRPSKELLDRLAEMDRLRRKAEVESRNYFIG